MAVDRYSPAEFEDRWYRKWLADNRFAPSMEPGREPFCIVIPPPNVTGSLHMGHAWDETLQDALIRWSRMKGRNTLWMPGTDHAGIATQWMVERQLREQGKTRFDLGRERFLEAVWAFKHESHGTITKQLQRLGVSCDWTRERFTLDEGLSRAVRRVFVGLYREGLIYRASRMVSWCPRCLTALSDLEVAHKEMEGGLWHIRYPFADGKGEVVVATTRPETMLGDTAVAVHPDDERYTKLVGRSVILPLVEKPIPVVADPYVDPQFGSGALKVTPGHDPNDFEIGKRNGLPIVTVMNEDGTMNDAAPPEFRGLDRFEARKRVVAALEARGLLAKHEKHVHAVGTCSRCGTVVEPRVSLQWWVKMQDMANAAIDAVQGKRIEILPDYQEKVFYEWMNNIQDWCISRQLWWGHRIPVWYCKPCGEMIVSDEDVLACPKCGAAGPEQDPDVLDTWFSSGLWPFSTMGWPEKTEDLRTFYPTSVLVTGYDILFFWVARMIMLGLKFMGEVPFRQVFLHGLLRDEKGEKMSKTKGNGIDPLEMIDKFGADALRFTLAAQTVTGRDMVLQEASIEGYRNFINKIWNAQRFLQSHWERLGAPPALEATQPGLFDRWILGRLEHVAGEVNRHLEARRFHEACKEAYAFVWHEYCDWYLEIVKPVLYGDFGPEAQAPALATLRHVLAESLKLLHPFMPFVTEELWSRLPGREAAEGSIMVERYPEGEPERIDARSVAEAARLIEVIGAVRGVRGENLIKPKERVQTTLLTANAELRALVEKEHTIFSTLTGSAQVSLPAAEQIDRTLQKLKGRPTAVGSDFQVFIESANGGDAGAERERLTKEIDKARDKAQKLSTKLGNPEFVSKAPPAVVGKNREELSALEAQIAKLNDTLSHLPGA